MREAAADFRVLLDTATSAEVRRGSDGTAGTRPFHVVNYVGSLGGARVLGHSGMERTFDRIVSALAASLLEASDTELARGMHFPTGWDPYFRDYMTLADVYHYATQHYQHHRRRLTLAKVTQVGAD